MARGGPRQGAGRKPGSGKGEKTITKVRKALAERIVTDGDLTPLQVMIDAMREAHGEGRAKDAAYYANMAAPYVHPRLSNVNANHSGEVKATVMVVSEFPDE
jgi:hypothetical protein